MNYLTKRGASYIIDILIVSIIMILIGLVIVPNNNVYNNKLDVTFEKYLDDEINTKELIAELNETLKERDLANIYYNLTLILVIISVFIVIPLRYGQTLGQKLFKLKFAGSMTLNNMLIRNAIVNGLLFLVISPVLLLFPAYFITITILAICQVLLVIRSLFMVIYRKDNLGLQDVYSQTQIVEL